MLDLLHRCWPWPASCSTSSGPKILGWATDVIFTGVIGKQLPAGATKEQAVAMLRAQGDDTFADMVQRLDVVPGAGIDFSLLGEILLLALGLVRVSARCCCGWQGYLLNGAVQRSIYRMRNEVQAKINRLPLSLLRPVSRAASC